MAEMSDDSSLISDLDQDKAMKLYAWFRKEMSKELSDKIIQLDSFTSEIESINGFSPLVISKTPFATEVLIAVFNRINECDFIDFDQATSQDLFNGLTEDSKAAKDFYTTMMMAFSVFFKTNPAMPSLVKLTLNNKFSDYRKRSTLSLGVIFTFMLLKDYRSFKLINDLEQYTDL
jgi:hypothetical protein